MPHAAGLHGVHEIEGDLAAADDDRDDEAVHAPNLVQGWCDPIGVADIPEAQDEYLSLAGLAFAAFDTYLRHRFWADNQADPALWNVVLSSDRMRQAPNIDIVFAFYGMNAKQMAQAKFHINNLAIWSDHHYQVPKRPGEYRVLVLGGEHTASSVWLTTVRPEIERMVSPKS